MKTNILTQTHTSLSAQAKQSTIAKSLRQATKRNKLQPPPPPPETSMPHHRPSPSSPFLSPPLLIIILPIITLLFLFFALPPFLSFTSQLLRPTSVKKSWDSLNIFFVLFAILCGVFAKRNDEDSKSSEEVETDRVRAVGYEKTVEREDGSVSRQWYGFSENKIYDSPPIIRLKSPMTGVSRLRRSSSSYPDLRQVSLWETDSDRYRYHFFDDSEIDRFRSPEREQIPVDNRTPQETVEEKVGEDAEVKEIQVHTVEILSSPPQPPQPAPKSPTPPPPPPPPAAARAKSRRTYQTVPRKEKLENVKVDDNDTTRNPSPPQPPSPPPPPPPPAPSFQTEGEHKRGRNKRRKSNVKREIAMAWASLSNQKKRKRKQRTTTKVDHIHDEDNVSASQPPPPPPPPPPPSVFQSWFKKGVGKNKKIHSVSTPPPPAPPPPPPLASSKRWSFRKPKIPPPPPPPPPPATEPVRRPSRPPLPTRRSTLNNETLLNSGNQSPLISIPPSPPPPPFKIPEMKFTVRGDFLKIRSTNSSRCGSPEPEEDPNDPKPNEDPPEMEMGGTISCPSPDVNVKASTFIARLRGEWKLEKINSMKEKQNLGLDGPQAQ